MTTHAFCSHDDELFPEGASVGASVPERIFARDQDLSAPSGTEGVLALCKQANPSRQPAISRRGFLSLLAGTGLVCAGGSLAPGVVIDAVADTGGGTSLVLYVLSRKQAAISFKDISDTKQPRAIPGATVKLYSYHTKTNLDDKTTNDKGAALYDIDAYSEAQDASYDEEVYQFWGKLVVSAAGYRTYETGIVRIIGGTRVDAPTLPVKSNEPYLQCLTMDDYDVQYASGEWGTFLWGKTLKKPASHSLHIKLNAGANSAGKTFTIGYNHGPRPASGVVTDVTVTDQQTSLKPDSNGIVEATFDNLYFCESGGNGKNFLLDGQLDVFFKQDGPAAGPLSTCITTLKLEEGALDDALSGNDVISTKAFTMEGKSTGLDLSCVLPDDVPVLRSVKLNVWYPSLPVRFAFSPFGKLALGIGAAASATLTDPAGNPDNSYWQRTPIGSAREQLDKKFKKMGTDYQKSRTMNNNRKRDGKTFGKPDIDKKLSVTASLDGLLELDWEKKKQSDGSVLTKWGGKLDFYINLSAKLAITVTSTIGPVPVFLIFELGAALGVDAAIKVQRPDAGFSSFQAYMDGTGIGVDLKFTVGLTLGVGIPGVLSGGARGTGYLRLYAGFVVPPENKSFPRGLVGAGFSIDLVFQVLIFKVNMTLYNAENPKLADTWASSAAANGGVGDMGSGGRQPMAEAYRISDPNVADGTDDGRMINLVALPGGGFGMLGAGNNAASAVDLNQLAVPVKQSELLGVCEQVGIASASNDPDDPPFTFSPVGAHHTGATCSHSLKGSGAVAVGERFLGAVPHCTKILQDVFSDSRSKVVTTASGTFLFRIGSVQYGEGALATLRSRVCISQQDASGAWVDKGPVAIDFAAGASTPARMDTYDYDFDVVANTSIGRVYLVVIAGTRPASIDEANLRLDDVAQSTIIISAVLNESLAPQHPPYACFDYYDLADGFNHTLLFPRAAIDAENHVLFGFLHRKVAAGESLFSGTASVQDFPAFVVANATDGTFINFASMSGYAYESPVADTSVKKDVQLHTVGRNFFGTTGGVAFSFITFDQASLVADDNEVSAATSAAFMLLKPDQSEPSGTSATSLGSVARVSVVRPWSNDGKSIAKKDSTLIEISVDYDDDENPILIEGADALLEGFHVDCFDVSGDGSTVFYTKVREGADAGDISAEPESSGDVGPSKPVHESQVFAARKVRYAGGDKLIAPYPLAQLDTPPDQITIFGSNASDATAHFVYTTITNLNESKADIYYAGVPMLKNLKLLAFQSENSYVMAGEVEPVIVTVQNLGNTVLTQFSLEIAEGSTVIDTILVKIHPSITLMSVEDVKFDEPLAQSSGLNATAEGEGAGAATEGDELQVMALDNNFTPCETAFDIPTENGVLLPGKTRSYRVNFTVPTTWGPLADKGTQEHTLTARVLCDDTLKLAGQESDPSNAGSFSESDVALASVSTLSGVGLRAEADALTPGTMTLATGDLLGDVTNLQPNHYVTAGDDDPGNDPKKPKELAGTGDGVAGPAALAALGVALGVAGVAAVSGVAATGEDEG